MCLCRVVWREKFERVAKRPTLKSEVNNDNFLFRRLAETISSCFGPCWVFLCSWHTKKCKWFSLLRERDSSVRSASDGLIKKPLFISFSKMSFPRTPGFFQIYVLRKPPWLVSKCCTSLPIDLTEGRHIRPHEFTSLSGSLNRFHNFKTNLGDCYLQGMLALAISSFYQEIPQELKRRSQVSWEKIGKYCCLAEWWWGDAQCVWCQRVFFANRSYFLISATSTFTASLSRIGNMSCADWRCVSNKLSSKNFAGHVGWPTVVEGKTMRHARSSLSGFIV